MDVGTTIAAPSLLVGRLEPAFDGTDCNCDTATCLHGPNTVWKNTWHAENGVPSLKLT